MSDEVEFTYGKRKVDIVPFPQKGRLAVVYQVKPGLGASLIFDDPMQFMDFTATMYEEASKVWPEFFRQLEKDLGV